MSHWIEKSTVYHIYPLGFCGAEKFRKDFVSNNTKKGRILKINDWIPHLKSMHFNALYVGPIFESVKHGYDTIDYKKIDARLGSNEEFKLVCDNLHKNGIKVILDGVFNHVGRDFFAFQDLIQNGQNSRYKDWFAGVNFGGRSPYGDNFSYEAWSGYYELVKLNLYNNEVVEYLLDSIKFWIDEWDVDGIRFDAADCLADDFIKRVHSFTKGIKSDFWLMGEIIHGNYAHWANNEMFDSVTNYQCYKGTYSSHNDRNFFEIVHSINYQNQQWGSLYLYNFLDNHDVARLMSVLTDKGRAACCYTFMYSMYGIPSVYYGSEFGIDGAKGHGENADDALRPEINLSDLTANELTKHIAKLGEVREKFEPLQTGSFSVLELKNQTLSFKREKDGKAAFVAINISDGEYTFGFQTSAEKLVDALTGKEYPVWNGNLAVPVPKNGSVVLVPADVMGDSSEEIKVEIDTVVPEKIETVPVVEEIVEEIIVEDIVEEKVSCVSHGIDKGNGVHGVGVPDGRTYKIQGKYRHFKGGIYYLLNVAKDHETCEDIAIYISAGENPEMWVRPLSMFIEDVDDHGNIKPRFELIG